MKNHLFAIGILFSLVFSACGQPSSFQLSATDFSTKLAATPEHTLIDVRTKEEFDGGHLENAMLMDWNSDDFERRASAVDKTKPVFIYCLSGGRSASAAKHLRDQGFKEVYEMNGGIMKWRAAGLPLAEVKTSTSDEISPEQFDALITSDKLVLLDFSAEWCAPCKKMAPYLEQLQSEMGARLTIVRIDVDKNKTLADKLNVEALPTLMLYSNKQVKWTNVGFIEKADLVRKINGE